MARQPRTPTAIAQSSGKRTESDLRSRGWRLDTLWNEPQLLNTNYFRE